MRFSHVLVLGLAACGVEYAPVDPPVPPPVPRATWYQDVAPIVAAKCAGCHQDGGIAPFVLTDPDSAGEHAGDMLAQVDKGVMPPFDAREEQGAAGCTPRFGWKDDARLTVSQKATLHAWVEDGFALGTVAPMPAPPMTALAGVSKTIAPAQGFVASGTRDQFMCTIMDPGNAQLAWMTGLQVRPGNPLVVHHVVVTELQPGVELDAQLAAHPIGVPFDCGQQATPGAFVISIWTPGNQPMQTPDQLAVPIVGGAKIVMQIHYHPTGATAEPDTTAIDLKFSSVWPSKMYFVTAFGNAANAAQGLMPDPDDVCAPAFTIPANKADHTETMKFAVPDLTNLGEVRLYSVNPHMHLVGSHIQGTIDRAAPPADQPASECLANGGWNFDWQRTYAYDAPLDALPLVQSGDTLTIRCHWNNTIENPFVQRLLHDAGMVAPVDLHLGEQTTNEMCLEIFGLALDAPPPPTATTTVVTVPVPAFALRPQLSLR